jgi:hypothetical protein
MEEFSVIGSTVSHDRILDKFGQSRRRMYPPCPWWDFLRHASIKKLTGVLGHDTGQLAHIQRQVDFRELKELERG